ncbi:hypothetical protein SDRG_12155 [Saprolegnia diclina VS20]|uniref:Uncharacterized protein n=1 Tax=Saprolegnia diclina (strain VS20) TaxID=1156394 RepID=T0Q662_SAPDV|nr:hypothetical protein SDRG_12155 [Saprolegnia diclina VS20]EQC30096.1 hypothetical protein SDRG_12155 [Saprolegnia diclina VS20]|eukprot:XP_008616439.1 hypothetical protein SDRG_12155 [Saprolegnia diclina VS20]
MGEIAIDDLVVAVDHCAQCATFADFLRDGTRIEFEFEYTSLCEALQALVQEHPSQLGAHNSADSRDLMADDLAMMAPNVVWKRATRLENATDLDTHVRRPRQLHDDTRSVAKLQQLLAIDAANNGPP